VAGTNNILLTARVNWDYFTRSKHAIHIGSIPTSAEFVLASSAGESLRTLTVFESNWCEGIEVKIGIKVRIESDL
jgi:hypothetical protein